MTPDNYDEREVIINLHSARNIRCKKIGNNFVFYVKFLCTFVIK